MSVLMDLALAVTRAIDPKRLYDWMIAISEAVSTSPAIIGVGPFDTVARASSARMLDVSEADCAAIENGSEVWCESFGGTVWFWNTAVPGGLICDNETMCRPTAWVATGNNGAFVRQLTGSRLAQIQNAWTIDSTAADNEGSGSSLDPLKTDVELQRRWGLAGGQIFQPTVVTYVNSPAAATNLDVTLASGASIKVVGVDAPSAPIVLTAVTAQNRATQTPWDITGPGLGAGQVGSIVEISASGTPANVGAYAVVLKDLGGGKVRVSPFGTPAINVTTQFTNVTPQIGDSITVHSVPTLSVGTITLRAGSNATVNASPLLNCGLFDLINVTGTASVNQGGGFRTLGVAVFFNRVMQTAMRWQGVSGGPSQIFLCGGGTKTTIGTIAPGVLVVGNSLGMLASLTVNRGASFVVRQDTICQGSTIASSPGANITSSGVAYFDNATIGTFIGAGVAYRQSGAVPDWGTSNGTWGIQVESGGLYVYATKPTTNGGLGAGREAKVGGTDKLYAAIPYVEGANNAAMVLAA